MVHVKKVEIFGFKSFGFKNTIVDFEPGLVSISGPNGSGKSNILDAITFALGENRAKIIASRILLFPDPFGPEIETSPGSNSTIVFLKPNDLNPKISTFFT